ncbi:MAG: pro-sigmaK processing inhibitor BofA family protein [Christensenellales bacterium]|nr:pro-sigmaK processing inhibitor BofA [Clostridiales bacterium]
MGIGFDVIIAYVVGLLLLFLIGWLLITPIKVLLKFILNGVIGGLMLWVLNLLGGALGISVAINPVTALIAGFLGVPGVILILLLQVFLA